MVNPIPNETELYAQIKKQKIMISWELWETLLYKCLGDFIVPIYLICRYYLSQNKPIPDSEARNILSCTGNIKYIVNEVIRVKKGDTLFPEVKNNTPLHPLIKDLFTYYVGNAIYLINLIVEYSLNDPVSPKQISVESTKQILDNIQQVRHFLYRLLKETASSPLPN
ncbi:hypothetical protein EPO66_00440 [bacterium]|nr:MAG: hypothetical protein EPO66_00440 [bacterium]